MKTQQTTQAMTQQEVADDRIEKSETVCALMASRQSSQGGFTLLEMMIVLVILGFLVGMIAPNMLSRADDAKISVTKAQMRDLTTSLNLYKLDNGSYPSTSQGLQALVTKPTGSPEAKNWKKGGYLPKKPLDSWGNEFIYISPGSSGPYDILSLGSDGVEGGEGDAADISSSNL